MALLALTAFAQEKASQDPAYVVVYADEAERNPVTIYVSPRFNTVIRGFDKLQVVSVAQTETIQAINLTPEVIQLNTEASSGLFGMTVMIGGRVLQFTVKIEPGYYNRTYVIVPGSPEYPVDTPATLAPLSSEYAPPAATPEGGAEGKAAAGARKKSESATLIAAPGTPAGITLKVGAWNKETGCIAFRLSNDTLEPVDVDLTSTNVLVGGTPVPYELRLDSGSLPVPPGGSAAGCLSVRLGKKPWGKMETRWALASKGSRNFVEVPLPY